MVVAGAKKREAWLWVAEWVRRYLVSLEDVSATTKRCTLFFFPLYFVFGSSGFGRPGIEVL